MEVKLQNIKNNNKYSSKIYKYYILKIFVIIIIISLFILTIKINDFKNFINYKIYKIPKIVAISYGNEQYQRQLEINKKSALEVGNVNEYYSFGPDNIELEFRNKNKEILSRERGNGYWLWKPYFILKTLKEKLNEGDYLIYTDAGILYMNSTWKIINFMKEQKAEIWAIQLDLIEKQYSKRDAFVLLGADMPFFTDTPQYMAGIQIYQKSKYTEKFLEEVLYYSQDKRIITDDPNTLGLDNYNGFIENRHDQTIFSLLIKKYGQASSGKTNLNITQLEKQYVFMPYIFCIYRRTSFIDYDDIRKKCNDFYIEQKNIFYKKK